MSATQISSARGLKVALGEIRRRRSPPVRRRRTDVAAPTRGGFDAELAHQPGDALLADLETVAEAQIGVQPRSAVGLARGPPELEDARFELLVLEPPRTHRAFAPSPVALAGDAQHRAQQGDRVVRPLAIDQPERHGS